MLLVKGGEGLGFSLCLLVIYISYITDACRGVPKVITDRTHTPPISKKSQDNIIPPQQHLCGLIKITLKKEQSFKTFIKLGTCAQVA
jgi:hypothetical protein